MPRSGCRLNRFISPVIRVESFAATSATRRCPLMANSTVGNSAANSVVASIKARARKAPSQARGRRGPRRARGLPGSQFVLFAIALERRFDCRAVVLRREHGDEFVDEAAGVDAATQSEAGSAGREQMARLALLALRIAPPVGPPLGHRAPPPDAP